MYAYIHDNYSIFPDDCRLSFRPLGPSETLKSHEIRNPKCKGDKKKKNLRIYYYVFLCYRIIARPLALDYIQWSNKKCCNVINMHV